MTYVVNELCIKCKYTDCVIVCPVDCFHEGENTLVIDPEVCIDCGVCEIECPINAITHEDFATTEILELNKKYSSSWPVITHLLEPMDGADEYAKQNIKNRLDFLSPNAGTGKPARK